MISILILFRILKKNSDKTHMTQEEKSLQRGAEWEQWGIAVPDRQQKGVIGVEQAKTEMLNKW